MAKTPPEDVQSKSFMVVFTFRTYCTAGIVVEDCIPRTVLVAFYTWGFFELFMYLHLPSISTVSVDSGIERRTVATLVLAIRRSNHSARFHPR